MTPPAAARVAVISHSHPSLTKGGAEIASYTLFRDLKRLGADPLFVAACPVERRSELELGGPDERAVFFTDADYSHFYHLSHPDVGATLRAVLRDEGCGVASFHHFMHLGANALRDVARSGVRCFLTLHEYLAICHHHGQMVTRPDQSLCTRASPAKCHRCFPETLPARFSQRRVVLADAFSAMAGFVSPSRFLKRRFVEWGLPAETVAVIENALAPRGDGRPGPRPREPGSPFVFGYFGQINPFKGVDVLLDAAERVAADPDAPPIQVRVHGNLVGPSEGFLARLAAAREERRVEYHGPYDNEEVADLMAGCDYVVVPSLWWENSPVVIQEAYAAGRPVIASRLGGLAEKVAEGATGLLFERGSGADLARALAAAADPEILRALQAGLPAPADDLAVARRYMRVFAGERPEDA